MIQSTWLRRPPRRGQIGGGEFDHRRRDTGVVEGLLLRERPGGEQGVAGHAEAVPAEIGELDTVSARKAVVFAKDDEQRFGTEGFADDAGRVSDAAAGDRDVHGAVGDGPGQVGRPHPARDELDFGRL